MKVIDRRHLSPCDGHRQRMSRPDQELLDKLLLRWNEGDPEAPAAALPLVYDELRRIASGFFRQERASHTLQATAIVHEAYIQLVERRGLHWRSRSHFVGLTANLMRRILVDYARQRGVAKRGGGQPCLTLVEAEAFDSAKPIDLVALDDALTDLSDYDLQKAAIVELRFFGGLTNEEVAAFLSISRSTVVREWRRAKAWLYRALHNQNNE